MNSFYYLLFQSLTYIFASNWNVMAEKVHTTPLEEKPLQWSYKDQDNWPEKYCKGKQQSPINIKEKEAIKISGQNLEFGPGFRKGLKTVIKNERYGVALYAKNPATKVDISKGGLNGTYRFLQLHFTWPAGHKINNKQCPLEMSTIFWATKYGNPREAVNHKDGLVTLNSRFRVTPDKNPIIAKILPGVLKVASRQNQAFPIDEDILLMDLIPYNTQNYYRYHGSVPLPYCEEIVTQFVFKKASPISQDQLDALKNIKDANNQSIPYNNRKIQPTNGRQICHNNG